MVEVSTSILQVDKDEIITKIYDLETAHTDYFHIDVMDGEFVKNNTENKMLEYCEYIKNITNIPLDVHLMVEDIKPYITSYLVFNPNTITFHIEACKDISEAIDLINYIKSNNCKAGISVKPNTEIQKVYELLPYVHTCLIMTVEPGEGGQELIPETLKKIEELKKYIDENNLEVDIEADGGINKDNVSMLTEKGVDIVVSGSAIIKSDNYKEYIKELKK